MNDISKDLREYLDATPRLSAGDMNELRLAVTALEDDPDFQADLLKGQFVEGILQAMEANGQTRSEVAMAMGKTRQYLSKVLDEDHRVNFTIETMTQLSHVVGRRLRLTMEEPMASRVRYLRPARSGVKPGFLVWRCFEAKTTIRGTDPQVLFGDSHSIRISALEGMNDEDHVAA